ncbi:MAG TPA: T9SS type A sorting domain-containing protein [Flavobacterium sp.]|jgi:hypothetical protein
MTKKLLLNLSFCLFFLSAIAQPVANPVPNMNQCGNEVFDLTVQVSIVLGSQTPADYSVTFHVSSSDANGGVNAISNPSFYVAAQNEILYIRITDVDNENLFDVTSFQVTWGFVDLPPQPDVTVCDGYTLPVLADGEYRTQPGGGGNVIPVSTTITSTQTLYIYLSIGSCSDEESFVVTVIATPSTINFPDVLECTSYVLPSIPYGNYYTESGGTGIMLSAGSVITQSTTIYWIAFNNMCTSEASFQITIGSVPVSQPTPLVVCSNAGFTTFNLDSKIEEITGGVEGYSVTFHETQTDAVNGFNAVSNTTTYNNLVNSNQTIYVRVTVDDCVSIVQLQLQSPACSGNTISGVIRVDGDSNGCTENDLPASNVMVYATGDGFTYYSYTNEQGQYNFTNVPAGGLQVRLGEETLDIYDADPGYMPLFISGINTNNEVNFCLTESEPFTDGGIYMYPTTQAVPGFGVQYYVVVHNNGSASIDGTATLNYNSSMLTFSSATTAPATQAPGMLTFDFADLAPLQSIVYFIDFMVATPPAANMGDINSLSASVDIGSADDNPANDQLVYNQTIVSSFDPNEIEVLEGATITISQAGEYLNYIVRFQNEGTSNAVKVVVKTQLDLDLDWSTFVPVGSSHDYLVERNAGLVTFTFNNINLVPKSVDEAGSQGFAAFRIKPKQDFAIGDFILATADIVFDFNAPITTNTVSTELISLGTTENNVVNLKIWPNPASGVIYISTDIFTEQQSVITVTDMSGKVVIRKAQNLNENMTSIDISGLESGMYMLRLESGEESVVKKLIVR